MLDRIQQSEVGYVQMKRMRDRMQVEGVLDSRE